MTRTNTGRGETHLGLRLELALLVVRFLVVVLVLHEALLACRRVDGLRRALDGLLLLHRKIDRYLELFFWSVLLAQRRRLLSLTRSHGVRPKIGS